MLHRCLKAAGLERSIRVCKTDMQSEGRTFARDKPDGLQSQDPKKEYRKPDRVRSEETRKKDSLRIPRLESATIACLLCASFSCFEAGRSQTSKAHSYFKCCWLPLILWEW